MAQRLNQLTGGTPLREAVCIQLLLGNGHGHDFSVGNGYIKRRHQVHPGCDQFVGPQVEDGGGKGSAGVPENVHTGNADYPFHALLGARKGRAQFVRETDQPCGSPRRMTALMPLLLSPDDRGTVKMAGPALQAGARSASSSAGPAVFRKRYTPYPRPRQAQAESTCAPATHRPGTVSAFPGSGTEMRCRLPCTRHCRRMLPAPRRSSRRNTVCGTVRRTRSRVGSVPDAESGHAGKLAYRRRNARNFAESRNISVQRDAGICGSNGTRSAGPRRPPLARAGRGKLPCSLQCDRIDWRLLASAEPGDSGKVALTIEIAMKTRSTSENRQARHHRSRLLLWRLRGPLTPKNRLTGPRFESRGQRKGRAHARGHGNLLVSPLVSMLTDRDSATGRGFGHSW